LLVQILGIARQRDSLPGGLAAVCADRMLGDVRRGSTATRATARPGWLSPRPLTVGELASRLGLTLPTVSGVLADLDRAGLVERRSDPADRRRTIVQIIPGQATLIGHWLDGAAKPLARVLDKLTPGEQEAFLKAMDLLETELHRQDTHS
jgi:DNA-binding MarR family transcriptional regulator